MEFEKNCPAGRLIGTTICSIVSFTAITKYPLYSPGPGLDAYSGTIILLYSFGILVGDLTGGDQEGPETIC